MAEHRPAGGGGPTIVMIYEPYPMGLGGNFLTQRLILERLDRRRFEPIVVSPQEGAALERFRKAGVECVILRPPGSLARYGGAALRAGAWGRLRSVVDLLRYNLRLARFLKDRSIDVVYANCVRAELSVGLACRLTGVPSLLYIKGELANPIIDRLCLLLASKVLFFCPQNRDDRYPLLVRWLGRKIDVLRIGMDPAPVDEVLARDLSALRRELRIGEEASTAVVLAQLYRPKGQHFAIEAFARLADEFPRLELYLVGDHVIDEYKGYRAELQELAESRGLAHRVRFLGWRKDALEIASLMDVVLHPSLAEGFGRAVLEAMALGKPVVASAVGGLREAIRDGHNGFLVAPGDVEAIAARWRRLLRDPQLRTSLGREARQTVWSDYLIDDKISKLAETFAALVGRRR